MCDGPEAFLARDVIKFLLNGAEVAVRPADPAMTLLDWLRLERRLTGAKEGCAEGDCGACTVLVGRLAGGALRYEAVNACIRLLASVDGRAVVTVESLKGADGALHPVQQAMVDLHASQCGFCTPGIVMSLAALWLAHDTCPPRARIEDALAGNLCRCTGYGPIIDAVARAYEIGAPAQDSRRVGREGAAQTLRGFAAGEPLALDVAGRRYCAPRNADALAAAVLADPDATLLAGGTDVGLWITKELRRPQAMISLGDVEGFDAVRDEGDALVFGAGASWTDCRRALGALHPQIGEMIRRFGSEPVRNMGTIGGNVANGSPIGDGPPVLIALGAGIVLRRGAERRELPLEAYFLGYKKQDRRAGEFVESIKVPKPPPGALFHVSKVTKRFDEDITAVLGAFHLSLDAQGVVTQARLAFGGMAATPKRAATAEAALVGKRFTQESAEAAVTALAADFTPLDDWRASARYRAQVAANLIRRFALEAAAGETMRVGGPLPESADA